MRKKSNKNWRNKAIASLFFVALIFSSALFLFNTGEINASVPFKPQALFSAQTKSALALNPFNLSNLSSDFSDIQKFEVANAKGTVVYFPQIHKDPATQSSDQSNDKAAEAQKEIYQGLAILSTKYGVKYIMDESDVYGPMPQAKIDKIKAGFNDILDYNNTVDKITDEYLNIGGSDLVASRFKEEANSSINSYERNIYVAGGAAVLAAKDGTSQVYGSQIPETLNKSKKALENLLYLQERINQLDGNYQTSIVASAAEENPLPWELNQISAYARQKNNQALSKDIKTLTEKQNNLSLSKSFEAVPKFSEVPHNNNPYKDRNDLANLKIEYSKVNQDFMALIKDQRSIEVSDNVIKMMQENNQNVAGLVFGSGHQDQIVQALNNKGYSVIVVTTPMVKKINQSQ